MNRRQSRDRAVVGDIADLSGDRLIITPYSERLFTAAGAEFRVFENPLEESDDSAVIFLERRFRPEEYLPLADRLIIYCWNREYPHDPPPALNLSGYGFRLAAEKEFPGSSHDRITKRIYLSGDKPQRAKRDTQNP